MGSVRAWRRAVAEGLARQANGLRRLTLGTLSIGALALAVSFSNGTMAEVEKAVLVGTQTPTVIATPEPTRSALATAPIVAATPAASPSPTLPITPVPVPSPTQETTPVPTSVPTVAPSPPPPSPTSAAERPQTSSRGGAAARESRKIVIDPGHGGSETGASRTLPDGSNLREKDLTLRVGLAAAELLRAAGHAVIVTRDADTLVNADRRDLTGDGRVSVSDDLQARIDVANREQADLFVSVHFNAGSATSRGTEVFYNANRPFAEQSRRLATSLYDRLMQAIRATGYDVVGRGVKRDAQATGGAPFFILGPSGGIIARASAMPAALGEALFISYPAEAELLRSDAFLLDLARAYADGVLDYLAAN